MHHQSFSKSPRMRLLVMAAMQPILRAVQCRTTAVVSMFVAACIATTGVVCCCQNWNAHLHLGNESMCLPCCRQPRTDKELDRL